jgi:dihydropteroate synthase
LRHFNGLTYYYGVAAAAIDAGAIVNDISAGEMDNAMLPMVGALGVRYIYVRQKDRRKTCNHVGSI